MAAATGDGSHTIGESSRTLNGAFGAIAAPADIAELSEAGQRAYGESTRKAYWDEKGVPLVTAVVYAGPSRLLAAADTAHHAPAYERPPPSTA